MLRENKKITQKELARLFKVAESTISMYERNEREPSFSFVEKLADFFDVSVDYLLGRMPFSEDMIKKQPTMYLSDKSQEVINRLLEELRRSEVEQNANLARIPVLGEIRAGYDLYAEQQVIGYSVVARDEVSDGEYFFLRVKGDSMTGDRIFEGDRVLVRRQEWIEEGKIAVVLVNGEEATLKRVYPQDNMVILQSSNPAYPPKMYPADEVRIQGQVVKVEFDV